MDWQTVQENWPAFVDRIAQRWPATDIDELADMNGDRARFTSYLASTAQLTEGEANEEIEAWLMGEVPADVLMDETRDNDNIRESGRHIPVGEDVYSEDGGFGSGDWDENEAPNPPIGRTE